LRVALGVTARAVGRSRSLCAPRQHDLRPRCRVPVHISRRRAPRLGQEPVITRSSIHEVSPQPAGQDIAPGEPEDSIVPTSTQDLVGLGRPTERVRPISADDRQSECGHHDKRRHEQRTAHDCRSRTPLRRHTGIMGREASREEVLTVGGGEPLFFRSGTRATLRRMSRRLGLAAVLEARRTRSLTSAPRGRGAAKASRCRDFPNSGRRSVGKRGAPRVSHRVRRWVDN